MSELASKEDLKLFSVALKNLLVKHHYETVGYYEDTPITSADVNNDLDLLEVLSTRNDFTTLILDLDYQYNFPFDDERLLNELAFNKVVYSELLVKFLNERAVTGRFSTYDFKGKKYYLFYTYITDIGKIWSRAILQENLHDFCRKHGAIERITSSWRNLVKPDWNKPMKMKLLPPKKTTTTYPVNVTPQALKAGCTCVICDAGFAPTKSKSYISASDFVEIIQDELHD